MSFVLTSQGKFDLNNIKTKDIRIENIAHGLTKICRYGSRLPLNIRIIEDENLTDRKDEFLSICKYLGVPND